MPVFGSTAGAKVERPKPGHTGIDGVMVSPTAAANADFGRNPVGTGPYKFEKWDAGEQVVVKRYDGYWGDQGAPLDSITFRFISLEATRIAACRRRPRRARIICTWRQAP